jgi:hypothetical protein
MAGAGLDVGGEREERRLHAGGGPGRGLEEARAQLGGELLALRGGHRLREDGVGASAGVLIACGLVRQDTLCEARSFLLPRRNLTTCNSFAQRFSRNHRFRFQGSPTVLLEYLLTSSAQRFLIFANDSGLVVS